MGENYSKLLKKKDWENYRDSLIAHLKNVMIDKQNFEKLLTMTEKQIEGMKDEVDEIVDEVFEDEEKKDD